MPNLLPWIWLAPALLLFWAAGAYNRLVRLRAKAIAAFAALDQQMVRQIVWVQGCLPESLRGGALTAPADLQDGVTAAWARLHAASEQFAVALAQARARGCEAPVMAGLVLSHDTMRGAWNAALADAVGAHAVPSAERLHARWLRLLHQTQPLRVAFNEAAQTYNQARAQFPASVLASMLGLQPVGTLTRLAQPHD